MNPKEILSRIESHYKSPSLELIHTSPFELLIAAVLSARCTDKRANELTRKLLKRFPTPEKLSSADIDKINSIIHSCSMHNAKAKYISEISKILVEKYDSQVPPSLEELTQLPGIARKTANIILSFGFNIPAIAVDTHLLRVSKRLGLTHSNKPEEIEANLRKAFPKDKWILVYSSLILHGRYICKARKPLCDDCIFKDICPEKRYEKQSF